MALDPLDVSSNEEANAELAEMSWRFWLSLPLATMLFVVAMAEMLPGRPIHAAIGEGLMPWLQMSLATPVVLWGAWPFFVRGWMSIVQRALNMFTLIALGTGAAYAYSVFAVLLPDMLPHGFRAHGGGVDVYFEAAAVITVLVLLGQVLELRARSRAGPSPRPSPPARPERPGRRA
jgi:Cu+-exporting ATPase